MSDTTPSPRFQAALEAIDAANAEDPNRERVGDRELPKELVHARRLYDWVLRLRPDASESLLLAARAQHLRRWEIPRSSYPEGKTGYLKWRTDLSRYHAEQAAEILRSKGYDEETVSRVQEINRKRNLASDPDVQTVEDGLSLVFLEHYFEEFAAKHEREKVLDIVRKTWKKMSARGHEAALGLPLSESAKELVVEALSPAAGETGESGSANSTAREEP